MDADHDVSAFTSWFRARGGYIDESIRIGIVPNSNPSSETSESVAGSGVRGVLATCDIPASHTLLTIPRALTLSTRTSALPALFGMARWRECALHRGWSGLILCMMWEATRSGESGEGWGPYFGINFDTPMFWSADELADWQAPPSLKEYFTKILPAVQSRPDIFSPTMVESHYSLATFHMMGSRILSRSFQVERVEGGEEGDEEEEADADGEHPQKGEHHGGNEMEVDVPGVVQGDEGEEHQKETEDEDEDEDEGDGTDITMVPMADMLNAQYESENAKLFYTRHSLNMVSTKPIPAGSQVWNTYGDLPNAELLRRYGHVDLLSLSPTEGKGRVRADLAVAVVLERTQKAQTDVDERVEWWLDEGGDDTFTLPTSDRTAIPTLLLSFILLLLLPADKWDSTRARGKPPKPKLHAHADDGDAAEAREVLGVCEEVLRRRGRAYPASLEDDERALAGMSARGLGIHMRNALAVRVGEQRALEGGVQAVREALARLDAEKEGRGVTQGGSSGRRGGKRERDGDGGRAGGRTKKTRK
ncbi:hypothetical protein BD779DRAFT_1611954 [Infundibulicybe gibba]|nr:hypothetical protein BD779DRAFT_1611954 [Infundibulicybe gibba]